MSTFRVLLAAYTVVFLALAIDPVERDTWFAENLTVWIIVGTLLVLRRRGVTFTPLAYALMFVLVILHTIGGHYTFARVPFGWVTHLFGFQRNHYDRIGHLMQGFGPAIVIRELLLRTSPLVPGKWLFTLVLFSVLGVSATYELTEWWAALAGGEAAGAFLGTQGDVWDTQWDMFLAGCGAAASQLLLGRRHDRQIAAVDPAARAKFRPPATAP